MREKKLILVSVLLTLAISSMRAESNISMAKTFGCSMDHKIDIKEMVSQCTCHDNSSCVWTSGRRPVMGCPCPVQPPQGTDYDLLKTAEILNCSNKSIEINKKIGQCQCEDSSKCLFSSRKSIVGCPCSGGRLPVESDFIEVKPVTHKRKSKRQRNSSTVNDL